MKCADRIIACAAQALFRNAVGCADWGVRLAVQQTKKDDITLDATADGAATATREQRDVVELPADARTFVVAGPGAGKTWTLLRRAIHLTGEEGVAVDDLLVLSFTRAVVAELRKRDRSSSKPSRVRPETFDAFAS